MGETPKEIDEKQLQEIFKRLSEKPQERSADKSSEESEEPRSSRVKRRKNP
jgi:hypothetical protein